MRSQHLVLTITATACIAWGLTLRPTFLTGTPIFGVSIHPDGTRLACGGADHKARIFSLLPVLNPQLEIAAEAQCPKLLCSLGDHFNPINAVCFSSMGRLATGSDDKLICIYELRAGPGMTSLGSSDGPAVENWKQIHALRGHSNSITDLSWSPEGDFIASSSLDNSVAIWNTQTGRRIKVLNGHESFVKGVAWDPVGKYLATLSDDRSVSIWRTEDWTQLEVVKDPFKRWIASTFSLRMSWSPEGQFLTVVNCFQSPSHTAAVLQRGNWNSQLTYFVGHKAPVVAASCNPHLFYPPQQQPKVLTLANGAKGDPEGMHMAIWRPMHGSSSACKKINASCEQTYLSCPLPDRSSAAFKLSSPHPPPPPPRASSRKTLNVPLMLAS